MTSDPVRLLDDPGATPTLRSDISISSEVDLEGLDVAGGLARLQAATGAVTSSTTVVAGTSLLAKLGIGAVAVAGALALWLGVGPGSEPADHERVAAPVVVPAVDREAPRPEPRVDVVPSHRPAVEVPVAAEPAPAEPELGAPPIVVAATDVEPKAASSARRKADRQAEAKPARELVVDDVLREAKLVAKARGHLSRDPARALALADEAERDFPQGQLVEERRAIAIRALVALGRLDEAQRRAEPFLAEHGRGAHAAAVRRAVEDSRKAP
jgi:type IV secretory pathway VirB10-like protein